MRARLRWSRYDDNRRRYLTARAERGLATPEFDDLGPVPPELELVWDGFWELSTERQLGGMGGVGPIPWSATEEWLDRRGVETEGERHFYRAVWLSLDSAYREEVNPKPAKRPQEKGGKEGKRGPRG